MYITVHIPTILILVIGLFLRALYEYSAIADEEISFPEGAIIKLLRKDDNGIDDGWWEGEYMGKRGVFPSIVVEELGGGNEVYISAKVHIFKLHLMFFLWFSVMKNTMMMDMDFQNHVNHPHLHYHLIPQLLLHHFLNIICHIIMLITLIEKEFHPNGNHLLEIHLMKRTVLKHLLYEKGKLKFYNT